MDTYKLAKAYFVAVTLCLIGALIFLKVGMSYFPFVWMACTVVILYLAKNKKDPGLPVPARVFFSLLGLAICLNLPNYSYFRMSDLSILLSGASLVLFSLIGTKNLIIPALLPGAVALASKSRSIFDPFIGPVVDLTFGIVSTVFSLFLPVWTSGHILYFPSRTGPQTLSVSIDTACSGVWSLGAFVIAMVIILYVFPRIWKAWIAYFTFGLAITYALNIVRICLVIAVGWYTGSYEILQLAHTHLGWVLFVLWMLIFWYKFMPVMSAKKGVKPSR